MIDNDNALLNTKQAKYYISNILGFYLTKGTIYYIMSRYGKKLGKHWYILRDDINRYMCNRRSGRKSFL